MSRYTPSASQVLIFLLGNMLHETQVVVSAVSCAGTCESPLGSVCCAKQGSSEQLHPMPAHFVAVLQQAIGTCKH